MLVELISLGSQMTILSPRMNTIKPSATLAISDKAKHMQSMGLDVISLGAGEPDFMTPDYINDAAITAIKTGKTKYTAVSGTLRVRSAIADDITSKYGISCYKYSDICVTSGAKQAIFNLIMAIIGEGDEVIIPSPYWVSYVDIVRFAGGTPVIVSCEESTNFKITGKALEDNITNKTKLLIINSPNNPTGLMYSREELVDISKVLLRHKHVFVMTDDIYEHIVFDNMKFLTIIQVEPKLTERTFIINGVSKGYAMTGWRIGYIASVNKDVISAIDTIQSQSTSNACTISQEAAAAAFEGDKSFMIDRRDAFQKRRDFIISKLNSHGLSYIMPNGAFYICIRCSDFYGKHSAGGKHITDDMLYSEVLLNEKLTAVVPGSAFGMNGYIRLSYATSDKNISNAIDRIIEFNSSLK